MVSKRKQFERKAGLAAFLLAEKSLLKKSVEAAERAGERWGLLAYRLSKKHRLRTDSNLQLAFPEMSEAERTELSKRVFKHFGKIAADFVRSQHRTDEEVIASCERIGFEYLDSALAQGNGLVLLTGHIGNWERGAHCLAASGYKLNVIARDADDEGLNKQVLRMRESHGIQVLSKGRAARGALKVLKENQLLGILPDQNSGDVFVPFFGKPCGTVNGPAVFHKRTGAPIVPFFTTWIAPGKYRVQCFPHVQPVPGYDEVEGMTRAINLLLEKVIRETPEQWLWLHDRWKSARQHGLI